MAPWARQDKSGRGWQMQGFVDNEGQWWPYWPQCLASSGKSTCPPSSVQGLVLAVPVPAKEARVALMMLWSWHTRPLKPSESQTVSCLLLLIPISGLHPVTENLLMAESINVAMRSMGSRCLSPIGSCSTIC